MTQIPYTPPSFQITKFNCLHCHAFAQQEWFSGAKQSYLNDVSNLNDLEVSVCAHCSKYSLWLNGKMLYPDSTGVEFPNMDLDQDIQVDYLEAASILQKSPRGACALLRLAVQKLCVQLGEKGKDINNNIANLVVKGLPVTIQQALDIVRVTGNEAVHPGELDLKDDVETAVKMFKLVNFIAEKMISEPKEIENLFDDLPDSKRDAIEKRDSATPAS